MHVVQTVLAVCLLAASPGPDGPPGFTVVLDGGGFANERFVMPPMPPGYANNYWRSSRDPRIDRLSLASDYGNGTTELRINVPAGGHVFSKDDGDRPDRNPYLGFDFAIVKNGATVPLELERVAVAITRLDPPGGRINGTLEGTLRAKNGAIVRLTGSFSVVRGKDRVVD